MNSTNLQSPCVVSKVTKTQLTICSVFSRSLTTMGLRLPGFANTKQANKRGLITPSDATNVPKGHMAVYVGETQRRRFIIPISYLKHPSFQELLNQAEEEFGFDHPMGGLTIPCREEEFTERLMTI